MLIAVDAVTPGASLEPTVAGMRHYIVSLVSAMSASGTDEFIVFESRHFSLSELDGLTNVRRLVCPGLPRLRAARVFYQNSIFPFLIRRQSVDVTLGTCNVVPIANPRPYVVVLQSLQYFVHHSTYGKIRGAYLRASVRSSLRRADAIIALSRAARDEAIHFTGVDRRKVAVVYHGVPTSVRKYAAQNVMARERQDQPYILVVSSLHRYKNVERVIRAYAHLRQTYSVPHRLRVVGQSAEITVGELQHLAQTLGIGDCVDFLGGIKHDALPTQYADAEMLVYASLHETFGLPPLEAMALGCPVVAARTSSLPEVVGDAGELVDPFDVSDIARGMASVACDSARLAQLRRLGRERADQFTWERTAACTLDVLRAVV